MKINIRSKINTEKNIVDQILEERGLSREWLSAGTADLLDGRDFRNFEKAEALLKKHLKNKIAIYVDSDTDGFCSSGIMYQWLKNKYKVEPMVIIPEGKVHGILENLIPDNIDLLIVPDASSSEAEIHQRLLKKGIDILILDHHEFNLSKGEVATIINPQHPDCKYGNKSISGTGVVYKFVEAIDKNEGVDFYSDFIDLAAIATVADVMNTTTMDNKAIINLGFKNFKNPYFTEYHRATARIKEKPVNPELISFYLVPPINALIRIGKAEEKEELFRAIVGELPPQLVVASVGRLKSKHDRDKEPIIIRIAMGLNTTPGAKEHAVIMTTAPQNTPRAMTGVIAGQMTNSYMRPIFLGQVNNGNLIGSARNLNNSPVENLKEFCLESGLFNWAAGHASAFGYSIPEKNISKFLEYCDNNLPPYEPVHYVDYNLTGLKEEKAEIIKNIFTLKNHFGPGFPEILVYDEMVIRPSDIALLGKNTLKVKNGEIEMIRFNFKEELPMDITTWKIVGKPDINEYMGRETPQIKLEGWIIEPFDL